VLDDHIDFEREHAYIVMELLDGETTRQRFDRLGALPPTEAVGLMLELAECLEAAHAANVIHRDIKPENLFLTKTGLKVLDFGIARALDGAAHLTQTGTTMGTPAYMAPEQARGKQDEITGRTDLYSVGATLLYLLSGRIIHEGDNPLQLMVQAAWTPAPSAAELCPGLPRALVAVIDRCCAFDPDDRFPDAAALATALREVLEELRVSGAHFNPAPQPDRPQNDESTVAATSPTDAPTLESEIPIFQPRFGVRHWLLALAAVGATVLGIWAFVRSNDAPEAIQAVPAEVQAGSAAVQAATAGIPTAAGQAPAEPTQNDTLAPGEPADTEVSAETSEDPVATVTDHPTPAPTTRRLPHRPRVAKGAQDAKRPGSAETSPSKTIPTGQMESAPSTDGPQIDYNRFRGKKHGASGGSTPSPNP
jgi:serine/threonine-protein kinase